MELTEKDLEKTIRLSQLKIEDEKKALYLGQMQDVLDQVATLDELDLANVEPSYTAIDQEHFQREDIANSQSYNLEENAPEWEGNAFRVPKIK